MELINRNPFPAARPSMISLTLVQLRLIPMTSASWKASVPMADVGTWPLNTTSGVPSDSASCMGVITLVAPGPDVTSTTPGFPLSTTKSPNGEKMRYPLPPPATGPSKKTHTKHAHNLPPYVQHL